MSPASRPSLRARLFAGALSASLLAIAAPAAGQALPTGGAVVAGSAEIGAPEAGSLTVTQHSQRAVVDWRSFSIGQNGTVQFQQNAGAAILNRVTGTEASVIAGALRGQGAVYLINPNGMAITRDGVVDVRGGFIGSTLGIKTADFMAGRNIFSGGPANRAVRNDGRIQVGTGGFVGLLGGEVSNDGVIVAPQGQLILAAGKAATLDLNGGGFLQVLAPQDEDLAILDSVAGGPAAAEGSIVALRASVARRAVRETVNVPDALRAAGVSGRNGAIILESPHGSVSVGGAIEATGGSIRVDGGSRLDISGALAASRIDATADAVFLAGATLHAPGGLVRVGGEFQGGRAQDLSQGDGFAYVGRFGPTTALRSADTVDIDGASRIDVEGGAAVVWSSHLTTFDGTIAAGSGAVEISAKDSLARVNLPGVQLTAGGRLLLDPKNLLVSDAADGDPPSPTQDYGFATSPGDTTVIWADDVADLLSTGASLTLQASNDLFVSRSILVSNAAGNGGDLTLQAGRSVEIQAAIQTDGGNLSVVANAPASMGVVDADREDGEANLDASGAFLALDGGNLSLRLMDGAGNTFNAAGSLRVTEVFANDVTLSAEAIDSRIFFFSTFTAGGAVSLTGNLFFAMSGGDIAGQSVTWTNEASATIRAEGSDPFRFVANGVVTRYGTLTGGSDATRLALGPETPGSYSRVYGDANPTLAGDLLRLVSGDLHGGDTLDSLLTLDALAIGGPAASAPVGTSRLTVAAGANFAFATSERGYWVDLTPADQTLTITPRTITASLAGATYAYGSPSPIAQLSGVLGGDNVAITASVSGQGNGVLAPGPGGYALHPRTDVGTRSVTVTGLTGPAAGNYVLDLTGLAAVDVTISPRTLTYACCSTAFTYGATPPTLILALNGLLGGDVVSIAGTEISVNAGDPAIALTDRTHAGTYKIRATGLTGADAGNYVLATDGSTNPTLTINRRSITYIAGGATTTYGNTPNYSFTGVLSGDEVLPVIGVSSGGGPVNAWSPRTDIGTYTASIYALTGANGGDYQIAGAGNTNLSFQITPRTLTVFPSGGTFVYGSTSASSASLNGLVDGDDVTVELVTVLQGGGQVTLAANTPVGTYSVIANSISGADASNYSFGGGAAQITITPKPVSYSIVGGTSVYGDGGLGAGAVTLNGILAADQAAISGTIGLFDALGAATTLTGQSDAGTYTARVTGLVSSNGAILASNYTIATSGNADGQLVITPRALTYSLASPTVTYGSAAQISQGASWSGFAGAEFATPIWTVTAAGGQAVALGSSGQASPDVVAAGVGAGTYTLSISGFTAALNGFKASNYTFAGTDGVLTIAPKPITYTVGAITGVYGSTSLPGATLNGALSGDDVVASGVVIVGGGALTARTPVGTYNVGVTALSGADAGNYTLAASGNADGTLTITPKLLSWSVANASIVYGDHATPGGATLSGVVAGDTVTATVTAYAPGTSHNDLFQSCFNGACLAGVNPALGAPLNAASYPLMVSGISGADAGNYRLFWSPETGAQDQTVTLGALTIAPRPVTLTVSPAFAEYSRTATYGYSVTSGSFVGVAPQPGEPFSTSGLGILFQPPAGTLNVGTYAVGAQVYGRELSNYAITVVPGTLTISPLRLIATVGNAGIVYGEQFNPLAGGLSVTFTDTNGGIVPTPASYTLTPDAPQRNGRLLAGDWDLNVVVTDPNFELFRQTPGMLRVFKRQLFAGGEATVAFGDTLAAFRPTGVLPGDEDFTFAITRLRDSQTGREFNVNTLWRPDGTAVSSEALPGIGTYQVVDYQLTGSGLSSNNYDISFGGSVKIEPRAITIAGLSPVSVTYGDTPATPEGVFRGAVTFSNLVSRTDGLFLSPLMAAWSNQTGVGTYGWSTVPGILADTFNGAVFECGSNCMSRNYVLVGDASAQVTVNPRPVTWQVASASTVYGTAVQQNATLSGLMPWDVADLRASLVISDGEAERFTNPATGTDGSNFVATLVIAPAGTYTVKVGGLSGTSAGNYVLTSGTRGDLAIARKPLTYTTADAVTYFGLGPIGDSFQHFGEYAIAGVLPNDEVGLDLRVSLGGGNITLARALEIAAGLDPNKYPIIAIGLTGASASNYVLAGEGNDPGEITALNFYALNQLTALTNPATQIVNAVNTARREEAAHPPPDPLPTTAPTGSNPGLIITSTDTRGGSTDVGGTFEVGTLDTAGCETGGRCSGVRNIIDAWAGVTATLEEIHAGAVAKDEFTGKVNFECGDADCSFDVGASIEVGAYASVVNRVTDTEITMAQAYLAGYGVEAGGSFGTSGELGGVNLGGGVTAGKVGIGGEASSKYEDGVVTVNLQFELHLGVGMSFDIGFSFDPKLWSQGLECAYTGCTTSYQTVADPQYALERQQKAAGYSEQIARLKEAEQGLVYDTLNGAFNGRPDEFNRRVADMKSWETRLLGDAAKDGFGLNFRAGEVTDRAPPEMKTVYVDHDGLFDDIADVFSF